MKIHIALSLLIGLLTLVSPIASASSAAPRKSAATTKTSSSSSSKKEAAPKKETDSRKQSSANKESASKKGPASKKATTSSKKETTSSKKSTTAKKEVASKKESAAKKEPVAKKEQTASEKKESVPESGFGCMKGSLPRPVAGTFKVTSRFGLNQYHQMRDVVYDNPGIDAEVSAGASVKAVYPGKVSGVYVVPGYGTVVIVSHDGYYTVYGNLSKAAVKVGDKIKQGHTLGKAAKNEENPSRGLVHFEVWKNRDKMDPLAWIK